MAVPNTLRSLGAYGLVANYREGGGVQNGRGGHVKFYPYEKGGGGGKKSFSHAEGGHNKFRGSFNIGA